MSYYSKDEIKKAKDIDLLTYLKTRNPDELIYITRNTYCTKEHDSLKINNGMWYWFSRGIGGKTALEYLIQVKEYSFLDAVEELIGKNYNYEIKKEPIIKEKILPKLVLPSRNIDNKKVKAYLISRGISENIIQECIDKNFIYQDKNNNVVFVGYDEENNPKYAGCRATNSSRYMHDIYGSDKSYSFQLVAKNNTDTIHLFESAIDLLSYITIQEMEKKDWYSESYISLAGVYQPAKEFSNIKLPKVVSKFLSVHPEIKKIFIHFDSDLVGIKSAEALCLKLKNDYEIKIDLVKKGKDYNDYLCSIKGIGKFKNCEQNCDRF